MYGIKDIVDVTLKNLTTKAPVLYLETLKVSSTEVTAAAEVSARGGRGNPKRLTWNGDKEVVFTAQDALISPEGLALLAGNSVSTGAVAVHKKEVLTAVTDSGVKVTIAETPVVATATPMFIYKTTDGTDIGTEVVLTTGYTISDKVITFVAGVSAGDQVIVDYYYTSDATAKTIKVTSDDFPGYYTLEGYTYWTDEATGTEVEVLYTMPKIKIKPDFKLDQAAEGDPSVFDFNMDVFPDANDEMVIITILE